MDDFTITVGPGTYLLTGDIIITGDDFTLKSSDGAAVTEIDCNEAWGIIINSGTAGDTVIEGLTLNDADVGITINGDDAVIRDCVIKDADNPGPGILINAGGTDATISDNTFDDCPIAIEFADMNPAIDTGANNIINCTDEYSRDDAEGGNNKWDNGSEGNYWSNYDGIDANSDGIGDTPYPIPGLTGSYDNYPLLEPYAVLVSLRIVVTLQGRFTPPNDQWIIPVEVWLHDPGAAWTEAEGHGCLYHFDTQTSNERIIELLVEPGTYDIRVKGRTTLKNLVTGVEVYPPGPVVVNLGALIEGDANGDNIVDEIDYSGVIWCFGYAVDNPEAPWGTPNCDFNNDGYVDEIDYSGVVINFGLSGADIQ